MISPDPDGAGTLKRRALKATYNASGMLTDVELGTVNGATDADWSAFTSLQKSTATYVNGRKTKEVLTASGETFGVTQYSYDAVGRMQCNAVRMDSAQWSSQSNACLPQATGANGPDRITKTTYDDAGRPTKVQSAYGTTIQADEATVTYTDNGQILTLTDAENNKTTYTYDGFDRLRMIEYPNIVKGSGTSNSSDYELLTYGDNVHVTQRQLRGVSSDTLNYSHDNLGRVTGVSGSTITDRTYNYNLLGMQTAATYSSGGQSVSNAYDALGRVTSQVTPQGTVGYQYDAASRRTRITWPDSLYVVYDYDTVGNVTKIRENGATSGIGVLASYSYDDLGHRIGVTYGNGTSRAYAYDAVSRLTGLKIDPTGTTNDLVIGKVGTTGSNIAYNPASQIASIARTNDAYAWTDGYNFNRGYTANGLNQYTASGSTSLGYDSRGNLNSSGSISYTYNVSGVPYPPCAVEA